MTRVTRHQRVAADPAGVALLLAEPASWFDTEQRGRIWVVEAPRRVGSGFRAHLEIVEPAGHLVVGEITVAPSPDGGCELGVDIALGTRSRPRHIEQSAASFLDLLAERARARALAA
jgi:hypothetical protein